MTRGERLRALEAENVELREIVRQADPKTREEIVLAAISTLGAIGTPEAVAAIKAIGRTQARLGRAAEATTAAMEAAIKVMESAVPTAH